MYISLSTLISKYETVFFFYVIAIFPFLTGCSKSSSSPTTPPTKNSLDSGLIAYYPFNGNSNDATSNKYNLAVQGATLTTDHLGNTNKAYHFNGTNAVMQVPKFLIAKSLDFFSVSVWVKSEDATTAPIYTLNGAQFFEDRFESMSIYKDGTTNEFNASCFITNYTNTGSTSILFNNAIADPSNKWIHLVLVHNSSGIFMYVNGIKAENYSAATSNFPVDYSNGGLIGGGIYNSSNYYYLKGDLDEIRFYSRALTETEIKKLYEQ